MMKYFYALCMLLTLGVTLAVESETIVSDEELGIEQFGTNDSDDFGIVFDIDHLLEHPSIKPFYDELSEEEQEQARLLIQELFGLIDITMIHLEEVFDRYRDLLDKFKRYQHADIFKVGFSLLVRDQSGKLNASFSEECPA